ncbi:MAG: outer membrane protein assembly factor BamB [Pseudomonadota bacterium]
MNLSRFTVPMARTRAVQACLLVISAAMLGACASSSNAPKPAELQAFVPQVNVRQAWSAKLGSVNFPLTVSATSNGVTVASTDGSLAQFDVRTGREIWRATAGSPLAAGVGSDGEVAAVVTLANDLVVFASGRELWRSKLGAQAYTAPLVAGGRVFVLAADRSVSAFDGQSGNKLWTQQRPGEPLVLRQSGVLLPVGDTLLAGLGGRLVGLNPLNGSVRWEAPIATPRGINDVERLVDLVGPVDRQGATVCVRAFQASVGCVDAARGGLLWSKPADGLQGVAGDADLIFGTEADGTVVAWSRREGDRKWSTERLRYRQLSAPRVVGRSIAIGDASGFVHLLSRTDGSLLNRLATDGSAIAATPVLVGNTLVVVTRSGGIFGFEPQ